MHDRSSFPSLPALDGLSRAVEELTAFDPSSLDDAHLSAAVVELQRVAGQLTAVTATVTGEWDRRGCWKTDGARSPAAWLAGRCNLPKPVARSEARLGRRLRHLPLIAAAFASGEINAHHARRLVRLHRPGLVDALTRDEAMLVDQARRLSYADFAHIIAYWEQVNDPERSEHDADEHHARRRAHLSQTLGGSWVLDALLDPIGGAKVAEALRRVEDELFKEDWADAEAEHGSATTVAHLRRTAAQRRADALVLLAERGMANPPGAKRPRPLVTVIIDFDTFAGRVCQLSNGTVLTPGQVATLLDEALIERIVMDGPSRILDVGHARLFRGALRRAIEVRDRHCTHPLCDEVPEACQVDHVDPHSNGGPTAEHNSRLGCPTHNRRWYQEFRQWRDRHRRSKDPPDDP